MSKHDQSRSPKHSRSLGFWALAIYGIGDILGADIYALIGEVAAEAGTWSPVSFLVAMIVAGLTGVVSLATVTHAFDRYSRAMWPAVPDWSV